MTHLTEQNFTNAGIKATEQHNDDWFAVDLAREQPADIGTAFVEVDGVKYEIWLNQA